jgi:hypothetical protein
MLNSVHSTASIGHVEEKRKGKEGRCGASNGGMDMTLWVAMPKKWPCPDSRQMSDNSEHKTRFRRSGWAWTRETLYCQT